MSGSPVIVNFSILLKFLTKPKPESLLLGTHLSTLDVSDRDPDQDERLTPNTSGLKWEDDCANFSHKINTLRLEKFCLF